MALDISWGYVVTRRLFEVALKAFLNPRRKTLDEILVGPDPYGEICSRIVHIGKDDLTPEERHFVEVSTFLGDVLNGGIGQALWNSSGDFFAEVENFAAARIRASSMEAFQDLRSAFPGNMIPVERELRAGLLERVPEDVLERFDSSFLEIEHQIQVELVEFARANRLAFENIGEVGRRYV